MSYRQRTATYPFVVLVGASGVGKTTVRNLLAPKIGAASLGRDDFNGEWSSLYDELDQSKRAVVECVRLPRALRRKAQVRRARIIHLTAPIEVRRERLEQRGETALVIESRLAEATDEIGYDEPVRVDLEIDTTQYSPDEIATNLARGLP